jgi:Metallo-beta-lactamase superfamily
MTIKIFQSGKGDALLISGTKVNILVDGGVSAAYTSFISKELNKLKKANTSIDLACVSHIDDDHIGGFLKMIEDMVDWRVFDFHKKQGGTAIKAPKSFRPADIKEIWHNAFHDVITENAGEIEDMLAANANILSASSNPILREMGEIALSKGQAIQLSKRLKPDQLNIPLNKRVGGKLVMSRKGAKPIKIGSLTIRIIAPFQSDLLKLRKEWNEWLAENKKALKGIKEKVEKDAAFLSNSTFPNIAINTALANELAPFLLNQLDLDNAEKVLGKREKVTTPNLASIMFLIEEGNKTALMTGDGHWDDIFKGLQAIKKLNLKKGLHVNVLKTQHHLSEHNINAEFCNKITADHYIFCGNGEHENPDLDALKMLIESRTTNPAITPEAKNNFTLWFNSSSVVSSKKAHMLKIEKMVRDFAAKHKNVKFKFMKNAASFMTLKV